MLKKKRIFLVSNDSESISISGTFVHKEQDCTFGKSSTTRVFCNFQIEI